MVGYRLRWIVICLAIGLSTAASGFDVPLKYRTQEDRNKNEYRPSGYGEFQKSFEPPGESTLPDLKSRKPIYGIFEAGDQRRLLVLDRKDKGDDFYNRIYFDANGNGDLTDDPVVDGKLRISDNRRRFECEFSPIDTKVRIGDTDLPYSIEPSCVLYSRYDEESFGQEELNDRFRFNYRVYCNYSGEFTVDDQRYTVWLSDNNGNGRFDDGLGKLNLKDMKPRQQIYPGGDSIYVTREKGIGYRDRQVVSDWLSIDGNLFEVKYLVSEGKMTLEPFAGETHPLKIALGPQRMTLATEDWESCLNLLYPGETVRVPAGTFRLLEYEIIAEDVEGNDWRVHARGTKETAAVEVGEGKNAEMEIGEPFRPVAQVPESSRKTLEKGRDKVRISLTVLGAGNEIVDDISRIKGKRTSIELSRSNPSRPKEPVYEIFDSDGEVVTSGSFEYG